MPRILAILVAIAVAAFLAACGGEDEQPDNARDLLARAFDTPVESGRMSLTSELQVDGVEGFGDGIEIRMRGPFTQQAADLDVSIGGAGPAIRGGFTLTEDNAYVSFGGRSYELGDELLGRLSRDLEERTGEDRSSLSLEALGVDVQGWLREPRIDGGEEVAGEPVTKVVAGLDASKVLADLAELGKRSGGSVEEEQLERLAGLAEDGTVEIYVSSRDDTIRRVALELEFEVPEAARREFGGAEGGAATVDVTFSEVGEPQEIEAPADARPLGDLLRQFGLGPELLNR